MEYRATIGLEIHAELKTKTKMFCSSKNDPDEKEPNVNICPVCLAHPGTLPVINKEAVKSILKIGLAVSGEIADFSEFDRKNYFYPDIPKSYQISQYKYPLVSGGELAGVKITRIHLEEDTAKSMHEKGDYSAIDFNRAGVPLMELVTEPVIKDSAEAVLFAKELQLLLRTLGVGEANMEKGEMRVEANVSVSRDAHKLGTKVEVKNLNSFKVVGKAIEFEIKRQVKVLEEGGEVIQETRGFNEQTEETFSQRLKESSHDYRYFPDPDLPKLKLSEIPEFANSELQKELPELPWIKRERLQKEFGIKKEDAEIFVYDNIFGEIFDEITSKTNDKEEIKLISNYICSDLKGLVASQDLGETIVSQKKNELVDALAKIGKMYFSGELSSRGAKDVLKEIYVNGGEANSIALEKGYLQKSDNFYIESIVEKVILENDGVFKEYLAGKESSLQFLIGQAMKESKGSANPKMLADVFKQRLG
jgi:aspartyl-tRNA(Asn)/glutamyl-tRNA(Gln) amidotransferase subunit B